MTKSEYNNPDRPLRVLVSGGGTGGHIFPAVSIANEVRRRHPDAEILFVGAEGRMEMQRVPAAGYDIKGLPVAGFDRRRLWRNFAVLGKLWRSLRMANGILRDFRPDIAVGVGGYASGPMLKAAQRHGIPTLLQEQNGFPGVTNKLLAKKADAICVAYDNMDRWFPADRIVMTGNPVRAAITAVTATPAEAKKALGFDPGRPLVLSVGGSLGAQHLNSAVAAMKESLLALPGVHVVHGAGKADYQAPADKLQLTDEERQRWHLFEYIDQMGDVLAASDLVVSRAGASSLAEIMTLGVPAVLVPYPFARGDHQTLNAAGCVAAGAACLVPDAQVEEPAFAQLVLDLASNPQRRATMAAACSQFSGSTARAKLADIACELTERSDS